MVECSGNVLVVVLASAVLYLLVVVGVEMLWSEIKNLCDLLFG